MSISAGSYLGPYEIISPIGKGGMGEVWKARDPRLGRTVAIKVSKQEFSERFEREARTIAALNHPNICQIYDVGPNYLVMEFIEGTTLKGPLPLDQALRYAGQICDALDAAHKKGITHRDLKPANILVTKAGVKLLDFGLAKMGDVDKPLDDATVTMALTGKNEIVGTLFYMSPEQLQAQADGRQLDGRSDIFSFGLVLYEMLKGKRAMDGTSPANVIAAIVERPAPSIADVAPQALDRVLKKCLAKDPDERWQTSRDLRDELNWIASESSPTAPIAAQGSSHSSGKLWKLAAAALAAIAAGATWIAYRGASQPGAPESLIELNVDLGPDVALSSDTSLSLSPDGSRLVYVSKGKLFTRKLDQPQILELAGSEGASAPFFSSDGKWVAFFAAGKLKKMPIEGGVPIYLCDAPQGYGGSWGEDGNIIFSRRGFGTLERISSNGGEPVPVTKLETGETYHHWPQILPGGKAMLATSSTPAGLQVEAVTLTGSRKSLVRGMYGKYLRTGAKAGHLIYVNNGALYAVPFDAEALELRGTPVSLFDQVIYDGNFGSAQFDASQNGVLVYRSGSALTS